MKTVTLDVRDAKASMADCAGAGGIVFACEAVKVEFLLQAA